MFLLLISQVADMLIKSLHPRLFRDNLSKLNMKDIHVSAYRALINDKSNLI